MPYVKRVTHISFCEACHTPFPRRHGRKKRGKFCSKRCHFQSQKGLLPPQWLRPKGQYTLLHFCQTCGRAFPVPPSDTQRLYCTRQCYLSRPKISAVERFWQCVRIPDDPDACWGWVGQKRLPVRTYPVVVEAKKNISAHRLSYELAYGAIPSGKQINHTCNNVACVNPRHLYAGTQIDNMHDEQYKRRGLKPQTQLNLFFIPRQTKRRRYKKRTTPRLYPRGGVVHNA